ncbi:MAG: carboxypeptidase-like regulatory domain-containing protein [Bryobacteraceae bacterium]
MPSRSSFFFILLAACSLTGQTAAPTDSGKPASVEGVVTDAVTGTPIPRVHVSLRGAGGRQPHQYATASGADGKFSITGIAPGSYQIDGRRVGFVMPSGPRAGNRVELKDGDTRTDLSIALTPTGAITGHVTDADGNPVEGATVEAQGGTRSGDSSSTDEQGQFRIGGLAPGRYRVIASHGEMWGDRPEIRTDGTVEHHDAATYYPGVLTEKEAGSVVVRAAGESPGVDIQMVRVPFVRVRGKVVGMPSKVERAEITVWHSNGGSGIDLKPDGSFELWRLDPGKYRLEAEWEGPDGERVHTSGGDIEVAGSNIDGIELRVVADSKIAVRLEFEDDQVKQTIAQASFGPVVRLSQLSVEDINDVSAPIGKDGTFRLAKVPAGRYRVGLVGYDKAYIKSMQLGSTAVDGAVLDLSNGSGGADLTLLLSASTGSISGVIQDDAGNAANIMVVLTASDEDSDFEPRRTSAGADGKYSFENLPPGTFKLVATAESDPATQGNNVLGYEKQMETVTVGIGEKVTKDLRRRMPDDQ